jgi:hypothetical protein
MPDSNGLASENKEHLQVYKNVYTGQKKRREPQFTKMGI